MSTSRSGWTSRILSIGPSDWPPAMILAVPSSSASSANDALEIARARIAKGRRLHAGRPSRARAVQHRLEMRRGVIGECSSSTPSGLSASLTALAIAAGGAMAPPSPMPFTPNSV